MELLNKVLWVTTLQNKEAGQIWKTLKDTFHTAQESSVVVQETSKGREETGMDESRPACEIKGQEANGQAVKTRTGDLGRVER